jgi:predicted Zn-dependent peptidase
MILFGLGREVLNDPVQEPEDVVAGLDAVTADDIQRVARDLIASNGLNLALIGPFEDEKPFQTLLS